jgi:hypothetical protein
VAAKNETTFPPPINAPSRPGGPLLPLLFLIVRHSNFQFISSSAAPMPLTGCPFRPFRSESPMLSSKFLPRKRGFEHSILGNVADFVLRISSFRSIRLRGIFPTRTAHRRKPWPVQDMGEVNDLRNSSSLGGWLGWLSWVSKRREERAKTFERRLCPPDVPVDNAFTLSQGSQIPFGLCFGRIEAFTGPETSKPDSADNPVYMGPLSDNGVKVGARHLPGLIEKPWITAMGRECPKSVSIKHYQSKKES